MAQTPTQLLQLARGAGWKGEDARIAAAIALAESGGSNGAMHKNTNGTTDYGLWQINSVHGDLFKGRVWANPEDNADMAHAVYVKQGWSAWAAYGTPNYTKALAKVPGSTVTLIPPVADMPISGAATDMAGSIKSVGDAVTAQLGKMAGMGAAIAVAVVLLALGVVILLGKPALAVAAVTTPVGKVAKLASTAGGTGGAHRP